MIRKILLVLTIVLMANSVFAEALYSDVKEDSPYMPVLKKVYEHGWMVGYPDGSFKPTKSVTRAEWANISTNALGVNKQSVAKGVYFKDLDVSMSSYTPCQIALYYDLVKVTSPNYYPNAAIKRQEAILTLANYLSEKSLTVPQANKILAKYTDKNTLSDSNKVAFAKAELFGLIPVTTKEKKINPNGYLTRLDVAIMLANMGSQEASMNVYEKTMESYATKRKSHGTKIREAQVNGDIGIIPEMTEIPVQVLALVDSQKAKKGDKVDVIIPWMIVTKDRYLLINAGAKVNMQVTDARKRKFLFRNGVLEIKSETISTKEGQTAPFVSTLVLNDKIGPNKFWKFKRIKTVRSEKSYIKLLNDVKVDLTSTLIVK